MSEKRSSLFTAIFGIAESFIPAGKISVNIFFILLFLLIVNATALAAPFSITNLTSSKSSQVTLIWTAPDRGDLQPCTAYLVKYSTSADIVNDSEFIISSTYYQNWTPASPGAAEIKLLTGLIPDTTYWFSIKSSSGSEWSSISSTGSNSGIAGVFHKLWDTTEADQTSSITWGDYDNDGDLDQLAAVDTQGSQENRVYRNDNPDLFVKIWSSAVLDDSRCASWGDFDNDGDLDQLIGNDVACANRVYRNEGNGLFSRIWNSIETDDTYSSTWGDFDNDGDLDQLIGNYGSFNRVYRNEGNEQFARVWDSIQTDNTNSSTWGDFDNDGDLDQLIGNYTNPSRVYRNEGNGQFTRIWDSVQTDNTFSAVWGDYDNDGDLDFLTGNYNKPNRIYENSGNGSFPIAWSSAALNKTFSVIWGDFDNDGDLDYFSGNDGEPVFLYKNSGGNTFAAKWNSLESDNTWSVAVADYDNDGDLDLMTGNHAQSNKLYLSEFGQIKSNSPPSAPASFSSSISSSTLKIRWPDATDTETTQQKGLNYEIRVATNPLSDYLNNWIVSPSTGAGMSPFMGNYPHSFCDAATTTRGFNLKLSLENTTFYWQVRTIDTGYKYSAWSVESSTFVPELDPTTPLLLSPLINAATNMLTLTCYWDLSLDPSGISGYEVKISTDQYFGGTISSSETLNTFAEFSLSEGEWYWTVRSSDTKGNYSEWASTWTVIIDTTAPGSVTGVSAAVALASTKVNLSWTAPGNNDYSGNVSGGLWSIRYSTDSLFSGSAEIFTVNKSSSWIQGTVYQEEIQGLSEGSSYYFLIKASDRAGNWSVWSDTAAVFALYIPPLVIPIPKHPSGIKAELVANQTKLFWTIVSLNVDGTDYIKKKGYNIYRSNELLTGWSKIGFVTGNDQESCSWIDTDPPSNIYYYKVRTLNTADEESFDSLVCDSSPQLNIFSFSEDNYAMISIPKIISSLLYKGVQPDDVTITVEKKLDPRQSDALGIYEFTAVRASDGVKIQDFVFAESAAKITLKNPGQANTPGQSILRKASGSGANDLTLFRFNGIEWIRVAGKSEDNGLYIVTSRLGIYMLKVSEIFDSFELLKVYPRIFTPDGDGLNDFVEFQFENPKNENVNGYIYDLNSGLVGEMKSADNINSLKWDGKTDKGIVALPGIYIYQIVISGLENKTINGTIVLAK